MKTPSLFRALSWRSKPAEPEQDFGKVLSTCSVPEPMLEGEALMRRHEIDCLPELDRRLDALREALLLTAPATALPPSGPVRLELLPDESRSFQLVHDWAGVIEIDGCESSNNLALEICSLERFRASLLDPLTAAQAPARAWQLR